MHDNSQVPKMSDQQGTIYAHKCFDKQVLFAKRPVKVLSSCNIYKVKH